MTNFDRWQHFMKDVTSPQVFIDMGFYWMVSAALQRRVWLRNYHARPIFPNLYVVLVAEPGVGKGLVVSPIAKLMKNLKTGESSKPEALLSQVASDYGVDVETLSGKESPNSKPLFHCVADSLTFQALITETSKSIRRIIVPKSPEFALGRYTHSSTMLILEEMATFFRKQQEDLMSYLLVAFDCGDFRYRTQSRGVDSIKSCCLSILAGSNPSFMSDTLNEKVIGEGFSSRTFFVYAPRNRFHRFNIGTIDSSQLNAYAEIENHFRKLSILFGEVKFSPDAEEYLRHYFEEVHPYNKGNLDPAIIPFGARKSIHVQKLAMAIHFAESLDMTIELDTVTRSLEIVNKLEAVMHYALQLKRRNPLNKIAEKIRAKVELSMPLGMTTPEIWIAFNEDVNKQELQECINYLKTTGQLKLENSLWKTFTKAASES